MDIIIREVKGYGWLPMLKDEDGKETYRGEYQPTPEVAMKRCIKRLDESESIRNYVL